MRNFDTVKITDLTLFPTIWDEGWVKIAMEDVDTSRMNSEQFLQFQMRLSANALTVKHARQKEEQAYAEGFAIGLAESREKFIRRELEQGKLTPAEIADFYQVPLAVVEALR